MCGLQRIYILKNGVIKAVIVALMLTIFSIENTISASADNKSAFSCCFTESSSKEILLCSELGIGEIKGGADLGTNVAFSLVGGCLAEGGLITSLYVKDYIKCSILSSRGKDTLKGIVHRKTGRDFIIGTVGIIVGTVVSVAVLTIMSKCTPCSN